MKIIKIGCAAIAAAVVASGCANLRESDVAAAESGTGRPGWTTIDCSRIQLTSVLGLNDEVLLDTNKFVVGTISCYQNFALDASFLGFKNVCVALDEMMIPGKARTEKKPHRLRQVELKRILSEELDSDDLLREGRKLCDEVCALLDIETPEFELTDIARWRKENGRYNFGGIRTSVSFKLAQGQRIDIRMVEASYVMRDGKPQLTTLPYLELDIVFNSELWHSGHNFIKREISEKVERRLPFGPSCADKLAKAIKESIARSGERAKPRAK